jgi:putative addiction module killer protein
MVTHVLPFFGGEILAYRTAAGTSPFARWREKLDTVTRARISAAFLRLEAGNFSAAKGVGAGVYELQLDFGPVYRVYFGKDGESLVILLGGGTKKRQQADIESARVLWQEYKQSKRKRE